jgi:hypothetical protein
MRKNAGKPVNNALCLGILIGADPKRTTRIRIWGKAAAR